MARTVTLFDVMVASASDVAAEQRVIRDVIRSWNEIHGLSSNVMLNVIDLGGELPPSEFVETLAKQIRKADLLVAVFWTRLASPNVAFAGGVVNEIESYLVSNKPALFYFSSAPVVPSSVDPVELAALQDFKRRIGQSRLFDSYDSPEELRRKVTARLSEVVSTQLAPGVIRATERDYRQDTPKQRLSLEAAKLLRAAAKDPHGHLLMTRTFGGLNIEANGQSFAVRGDSRSEALWEAAVLELKQRGLVSERGHRGEVFNVTNEGYKVADGLPIAD
jgi:hypothetical protein